MPILTMTTSNRCNTSITLRHNTHKGKRSQRSRTTILMLTIEHTMYKHLIIFHLFMIMISQLQLILQVRAATTCSCVHVVVRMICMVRSSECMHTLRRVPRTYACSIPLWLQSKTCC